MSFLKNEYGIISGFCGVCTVLKKCIVCFDPQCLMKRWAYTKGKPVGIVHVPVYRRLDISQQTSGSPVTCFQNQSPTLTISSHKDPALERNTWDLMDGLFVLFFFFFLPSMFESMFGQLKALPWVDCWLLMEGSRQFHYVACAWTWWHV